MGLIEKSIRNRSNQKLASEVFAQTELTFDEVISAVRAYCDAINAGVTRQVADSQANAKTRFGKWTASLTDPAKLHYYVSPHPETRRILIGFGQRPEPILAGRGNTSDGVWAARLSYPAGGSTVGMALLKWVINNDGVLRNRGSYESLLENVHKAIGTVAGSAVAADPVVALNGSRPADLPDPASVPADLLVQGRQVPIGEWAAGLAADFPFLELADITALAGMRALLATDTGYFSSIYGTERRAGAANVYDTSTHSLLRSRLVMPGGTTYLSCGAPRPDHSFAADWQFSYRIAEDGRARIEVQQHRTTNGSVTSAELLVRLQDAVIETLKSGIHLRLADGPPVTDGLVVPMSARVPGYPDNDNSPFVPDYLGGVSVGYSTPLELPVSARGAVLAAMRGLHFREAPATGDVLCAVSLAGGRPFWCGAVTLRQHGEVDLLAIDLPATITSWERERSYRAAMRFLVGLFRALEPGEPELSETIAAHMRSLAADTQHAWAGAAGTRKKDRPADLWMSNWDRVTVAPMVPVAAGRWYPVGVRVTAPAPVDCLVQAMAATDWVTSYKRLKPILREDGRPTGKSTFTSRRCGLLYNSEDKLTPCVRFASAEEIWDQLRPKIQTAQAWFWEVTARSGPAGEGAPEGDDGESSGATLLVTGWSHADGVLGYGEDLLSMLRAFADVISATDDRARIQTLYLAT